MLAPWTGSMRRVRWRRAGSAAAIALALLGGCTNPQPQRFAPLSFAERQPIRLDVARLDVSTTYAAPLGPPNVEHVAPIVPETALKRWAGERLLVAGIGTRVARFVITEASIVEIALPRTQGVIGSVTIDQGSRFELKIAAALEIQSGRTTDRQSAGASATVTRSRTLREDATLNERDRLLYDLVRQAMTDFDAEMDRQLRRHL